MIETGQSRIVGEHPVYKYNVSWPQYVTWNDQKYKEKSSIRRMKWKKCFLPEGLKGSALEPAIRLFGYQVQISRL